jgi:MarR family transcriptional regulator, organic hydroperoxide resistance regulator
MAIEEDPAQEAWGLLWRVMQANKPRFMALAQEMGLAPMQLHALRLIEPGDGVPMSSLAGMLFCDASNVTGIVDRLEARGLIERRPSPKDRRVKLLVLTEEGARVRESAYRQMATPPPAIAALPLKHKRALRDALRATFEQQADEAAGAHASAPATPTA